MEQENKKQDKKEYWRKYYLKNKKLLIERQKGKYVKIPKLKGRKEMIYADGLAQEIQKQVPQMMGGVSKKILEEPEQRTKTELTEEEEFKLWLKNQKNERGLKN